MNKTISILAKGDHRAYKYWAGYIMREFKEFTLMSYSGTEKKEFSAGFMERPADIAILFRLAESEKDGETESFVRALKKASNKTKIIGIDLSSLFGPYFSGGADFMISLGGVNNEELRSVKNLAQNEEPSKEDKNIVYEKKDFYDYVAENGMFNKRAKKTAYKGAELNTLALNLVINRCDKVLDVGCGNGRLSIPLAELKFDVTGIDISEKLIRKARKRSNGINPQFIVGDILNPPFNSNVKFDAVIMMWHVICEFRSRRNDALRNAYKLLRPKGLLIFDFPDRAKNVEISKQGIYSSKVNSGFKKYLGLVPDVKNIVETLEHLGFDYVGYKRLKWGIHKFCVIARKHS